MNIILDDISQSYLFLLLRGERNKASQLILDLAKNGTPVKEIYLQVFQPAQYEIGRLWQTNKISVAEEHYCSAATQLIMSQLYPYVFSSEKIGRTMVATCVSGELHEIGVRMVADFFEMEGWDTYYLGANMPAEGILKSIEEHEADIIGISTTMLMHVGEVGILIDELRSASMRNETKILVGGYPFNVSQELWRKVGADGFASNAQEAIRIAKLLIED